MAWFYTFAWTLTRILFFPIYPIKYIGRGNIPTGTEGWVIACNHRSALDPIFLAHGVCGRQVYYMAKAELIKIPVVGRVLRWLHVFPVERGTGDTSAVDHAIQKLRDGGLLGIFPEGTRSPNGQPQRFKSGMAHIAYSAHVGVVPCVVRFSGKMRPWRHIEIEYGKPMSYEELFGDRQSGAALKQATKLVRERIVEMLGSEDDV